MLKPNHKTHNIKCVFFFPFVFLLFTFFQLFDFALQASIFFNLKAISILEGF
jgi:hypothetical protein